MVGAAEAGLGAQWGLGRRGHVAWGEGPWGSGRRGHEARGGGAMGPGEEGPWGLGRRGRVRREARYDSVVGPREAFGKLFAASIDGCGGGRRA